MSWAAGWCLAVPEQLGGGRALPAQLAGKAAAARRLSPQRSPSLTIASVRRTCWLLGQNALLHTSDDSLYTSTNWGFEWREVPQLRGEAVRIIVTGDTGRVRALAGPAPTARNDGNY